MGDEARIVHRFAPADDRLRVLGTLERETQKRHLESVSWRIAGAIIGFCKERIGKTFHADELRKHVEAQCGQTAPGSADRVLRDCRQRGLIDYEILSRSRSLYFCKRVV